MFTDNTFRYSEERRRELLQDAHQIQQAHELKKRKKENKKLREVQQSDFTDYVKTGLAAIFHR